MELYKMINNIAYVLEHKIMEMHKVDEEPKFIVVDNDTYMKILAWCGNGLQHIPYDRDSGTLYGIPIAVAVSNNKLVIEVI